MAKQSAIPEHRKLPSKENSLFKSIARCYETKQYKKGLKAADSILKRCPEHGETLAMRGLILNCLDRKEEAREHVRLGLRADLRSHVCWHVYGLLYRSEGNYEEAIKCYRNALRIDRDNVQILRDMSLLQVQTREFEGFMETRRLLTTLRPEQRINWIGFAVAAHLSGDHALSLRVIDSYIDTLAKDREMDYTDSELLLYRNDVLLESGDLAATITHLDQTDASLRDRYAVAERRAAIFARQGRWRDAANAYLTLISRNPDNYGYHRGLQAALLRDPTAADGLVATQTPASARGDALSAADRQRLLDAYATLQRQQPRCAAHRRIPLFLYQGDSFRDALDAHMRRGVSRGAASLYPDIEQLVTGGDSTQPSWRLDAALALARGYVESIRDASALPGDEAGSQPPSALCWALLLQGRLLCAAGRHSEAVAALDEAIAHTPTLHDLYLAKAAALAAAGDATAAAEVADHGRSLDLADRFLNVETCKRLLAADQIERAEQTMTLFTRAELTPQQHMREYQVSWFTVAEAEAHERSGRTAMALKRYHTVLQHFADYVDDQFDFHSYVLRKTTLRAYLRTLRNSDVMRRHPFWRRAAHGALRCYMRFAADPPHVESFEPDAEAMAAMNSTQKKKYKNGLKRKKETAEKRRKAAVDKANTPPKPPAAGAPKIKQDLDPMGEEYLTKDFKAEALAVATDMRRYNANSAETHFAAFDAASLSGRWLLAAHSLSRAAALAAGGSDHPEVHARAVALALALRGAGEGAMHPAAKRVASEVAGAVLHGASPEERAEAYAATATATLAERRGAARALLSVGGDSNVARAKATLSVVDGPDVSVSALEESLAVLQSCPGAGGEVAAFRKAALAAMPMATAFGAASQAEALKEEMTRVVSAEAIGAEDEALAH